MTIHDVNAFSNTCFQNNKVITEVDCRDIPWTANNMQMAFYGCNNLTQILVPNAQLAQYQDLYFLML